MEDKKKQIKEQLEKTVDLSKKLQEPRNDEEQQMLDNIWLLYTADAAHQSNGIHLVGSCIL